jgi:D-glycero-D-manno-heptose 1,7-bisphosphate phosphatase
MSKKVIFIDRDGVINKKMPEGDYVKTWSEFEFLPGAIEALKMLYEAGYSIFVITNQRGIARGIMRKEDLDDIHNRMAIELEKYGVKLVGIYYCPHNDEDNCDCRKPKPGLLLRAAKEHNFDLKDSIFIGDSIKDIQAGINAGCRTILVDSKKGLIEAIPKLI